MDRKRTKDYTVRKSESLRNHKTNDGSLKGYFQKSDKVKGESKASEDIGNEALRENEREKSTSKKELRKNIRYGGSTPSLSGASPCARRFRRRDGCKPRLVSLRSGWLRGLQSQH